MKISIAVIVTVVFLAAFSADASAAEDMKPRFVAHGGGFVAGYETTNSVEAVTQSIADGYKLIELDMDFSADGKLIMIHDWNRTARHYFGTAFKEKLTEKEFEKILINGKFHTLTFKKLTEILDEAEDIRIVTDTKGDNISVLSEIAEKYPDYAGKMIPQIYSYEEYDAVRELGYEDVILTLYAMPDIDYEELKSFIKSRELYAVTVGDGHDYLIKDLEYRLAKDGVCVYYHPVRDFETAALVMKGGVYGVYSNRIIPGDFEEPARSYYLLDGEAKLCDSTLPEKSFVCLKDVRIQNGSGKDRRYLIDGAPASGSLVNNLAPGEHDLEIILTSNGTEVAELNYLLWTDGFSLRVTDKRYAYRIGELESFPDKDEAALAFENISGEAGDLLSASLVIKSGEYYGYSAGSVLTFSTDGEFLYAQNHAAGPVISPFAECIKALGAESVSMSGDKYVYVYYGGVRTMLMADTAFISRGFKSERLDTPLTLVRDKLMASGEVYGIITGREYVENRKLMIVLPENVKASEVDADELLEAAALLFGPEE